MSNSKKSTLFRSVIPSIIVIGFVVFTLQQFEHFEQTQSQELIDEFKRIVDNLIDKRISNIKTISNSIIGFYLGSEKVETHEFNAFAEKILESNPDITNLFILEGGKITQSYPYTGFQHHVLEDILPGYPILINEQETMAIEFPMLNNEQETMAIEFPMLNNTVLVIGIPFDYFISAEILGHDPIKVVLFNPVNSGILYQYDSTKQNPDVDVIFNEKELQESILITKQTSMLGHKINQPYVLEYRIWTDDFNPKLTIIEIGMIFFGIIFATVLSVLLYNSLTLQHKLQTKTREVEQTNEDLNKAIQARNEFSTMISHELKTPLTPIKGFCKMLKNPKVGSLNQKQSDYLNEINTNAEQLESLIENLLLVRKLDMDRLTFQITNVDVTTFLTSIYENWNIATSEKNLKLAVDKEENMCIKADEKKLRQIFSNLIKNAIDFVPENTGKIQIKATTNDGFAIFCVKDNGIGISKENQEKLFQKFYQVDTSKIRKHGGTGLGLSICKGLVKGMNGSMWVESELGKGTAFYFKIPLCNIT